MPGGIHPPPETIVSWGPRHNYEDPFQKSGLVPVIVMFTVLTVWVVSARIYVRGVLQKDLGLDDWLIIAAIPPIFGLSIVICLAPQAPFFFGRHVWDIPLANFVDERKLAFAIEVLYTVASSLVKLSIFFFYRRLSSATFHDTYGYIIWGAVVFVTFNGGSYVLALILSCRPFDAFWNQLSLSWIETGRQYKCIDEGAATLSASVASVFMDLLAALLPTWLFWSLNIPVRQKIALACVFAVGFITCTIACIRTYLVWKIYYDSWDIPYYAYSSWLCLGLEVLMGAICASTPPLKVLLRKILAIRQSNVLDSSSHEPVERLQYRQSERRNDWMNWSRGRSRVLRGESPSQSTRRDTIRLNSVVEEHGCASPIGSMEKGTWYEHDEERAAEC